ncbi:hypothetical protein [Streptomyces sp. NRRL S-244]|uniref:hypothetical protein n=1 Tax=Streptomyces sp. NRRL S-244 TaxID=1463897 RepID=UPI000AA59084|nr:hypothetical protein [Streptomyces sp. NRRL S-244]
MPISCVRALAAAISGTAADRNLGRWVAPTGDLDVTLDAGGDQKAERLHFT